MHFVEFEIGIEFLYQGSSFFRWSLNETSNWWDTDHLKSGRIVLILMYVRHMIECT